jgi:hypothetical protein
MPEVVLALGNRRQQVCPFSLHREILRQIWLFVTEDIPRAAIGEVGAELKLAIASLGRTVSRLRKSELVAVTRRYHDESLASLRNAVLCGFHDLEGGTVTRLRSAIDVIDQA